MYTPKYYQNHDAAEVKDFIRQNSFGILVSQAAGKLWGTHIPMELTAGDSKLQGHISKGNPQWKNFNDAGEVMAIFTGPHGYISSSWYDHENVPTWNYIAAHVYGTIRIIEGDELLHALKEIVNKYEKNSERPVSVEKMSPSYIEKAIHGIVGFEITITDIQATYKLSQNRDSKNHEAIISQLEKRNDGSDALLAEAMRKKSPSKNRE
jgi:transcriptional regulator